MNWNLAMTFRILVMRKCNFTFLLITKEGEIGAWRDHQTSYVCFKCSCMLISIALLIVPHDDKSVVCVDKSSYPMAIDMTRVILLFKIFFNIFIHVFNSIVFSLQEFGYKLLVKKTRCNGDLTYQVTINSCLSYKKLETIMSHYLTPINEASQSLLTNQIC